MNTNKMEQIEAVFADMTGEQIAAALWVYGEYHVNKNIPYFVLNNCIKDKVREELEATITAERSFYPEADLVKRYESLSTEEINDWINDTSRHVQDVLREDFVNYIHQVSFDEL